MSQDSVYRRVLNWIFFDITHIDKEIVGVYARFFQNKLKSYLTSEFDLSSEMWHWERHFHESFIRTGLPPTYCSLLPTCKESIQYSINELKKQFSGTLKFIEVGCGPNSQFNSNSILNDSKIEVITVDPLADTYTELHKMYQSEHKIPCLKGYGESLDQMFPESSFHLVYTQNAIDHSQNPCKFINNLYKILKPNCFLILHGFIKEGTAAHWLGLHQWDIFVENDDLILTNKTKSIHEVLTKKFSTELINKNVTGNEVGSMYTMIYKKKSVAFE